jgi:hypothetical protein
MSYYYGDEIKENRTTAYASRKANMRNEHKLLGGNAQGGRGQTFNIYV